MFRALLAVLLALCPIATGLSLASPAPTSQRSSEAPIDVDQEEREEAIATPAAVANGGRLLPTTLAVFPGIALHGLGHWVDGDRKTAFRLMRYQLLGLGIAAVSGLALQLGGGTRYGNEVTIPSLIAGSGLLVNSYVADIFGSASRGTRWRFQSESDLHATLGYAYIYDPVFSYKNFSVARLHGRFGDTLVDPELWTALDANNQRARIGLAYEFLGNAQGEFLRLHSAFTYHHFGDDDFATYVGELSLQVRVEMSRLGDSLAGSFTTASYGLGLERTSYKARGLSSDDHGLLLGHFGYGFYLPKSGELEAYYEHRRDTFTAGISPSTRNGSGFLGHLGLRLQQPIHSRFTAEAQAEIGSALLIAVGLRIDLEKRL